jgi:hypothetical protein
VDIAEAARKHGIPDDHMLHAVRHPLRVVDQDERRVLVIGADPPAACSRWSCSTLTASPSSSTPPRCRPSSIDTFEEVSHMPRTREELEAAAAEAER